MWSQSDIPGIEKFTIDYEQLEKDCVDSNIKLLQIDDQKELVNYETVRGYYFHPKSIKRNSIYNLNKLYPNGFEYKAFLMRRNRHIYIVYYDSRLSNLNVRELKIRKRVIESTNLEYNTEAEFIAKKCGVISRGGFLVAHITKAINNKERLRIFGAVKNDEHSFSLEQNDCYMITPGNIYEEYDKNCDVLVIKVLNVNTIGHNTAEIKYIVNEKYMVKPMIVNHHLNTQDMLVI